MQREEYQGCLQEIAFSCFFKVLDLAGVNAWIIYNTKSGSNISRRKFLFQLSEQLRESEVSRKAEVDVCPVSEGSTRE